MVIQNIFQAASTSISFSFTYTWAPGIALRHIRMQAVRSQIWTCIAWGSLLPSGNSQLGALFLGKGSVFVFSPVIYHSVLDLTLQEMGAAVYQKLHLFHSGAEFGT